MSNEFPYSEQYRLAGEEWADKDAAARLLEDTKDAVVAQKQAELGDLSVAKAKQTVQASQWYLKYVERMVLARTEANKAKIRLKYAEMRYYENQSREASGRAELRMLGGDT